jgi:Rod binding domain-containing protein
MDAVKPMLAEVPLPQISPEQIKKADSFPDAKKKQYAKDFESIFINKMLDEMRDTTEWGLEKDDASGQVDGIFNLYLARDLADNGGFGLWKDIYKSLKNSQSVNSAPNATDKKL